MDFQTMIAQMKGHFTVESVVLLVLLIASEVLGTNDSIKASSIYGLAKAVLMTIKDQVWPQPTPAPATPPVA